MFYLIIIIFCTIFPLLGAVAIFTLFERKIMGSIQRRRGPNIIGFWGILQAFADGLKLILKESIFISKANLVLYFLIILNYIYQIFLKKF